MGLTANHLLGRNQKFFLKKETVNGTFVAPAATNAMAVLKTSIVPKVARKDRFDAYQLTRDVTERITGKSEYSWTVDAYYVPSGTKNVAPNCGPFIQALLGTETVNANDVTYSQSSSQLLSTLSLERIVGTELMESLAGAWVNSMTLKCTGSDEPKIHFEGGAMTYAATGYSVTNGGLSGGESSFTVANSGVNAFDVNSVITVGSSTGHTVTGISGYVVSVSPVIVGAQLTGVSVLPYVPTWTDAGVPTTGITGSCTWDSQALVVTSFELTVKSNLKALRDNAFTQNVSDLIPGLFEITGNIGMRIRVDHLLKILDRKAFATKALAVVIGGVAATGTRLELSLPYCEADFSEIQIPESEETTISFPFKALGSVGNDAIVWKHT